MVWYKNNVYMKGCVLLMTSLATLTVNAQIEEIVVTAQKHAQSVNDIGITVNAFTGEQLKQKGVVSAEDIALLTPGLTVNESAATGVPLYTIRGVGLQDYSTAASSTVGLYFDEVAVPYTVMSRGLLLDVERVEVLKGPQGDLYGRNTTAGQINFISKKPSEDFSAGVTMSYSSFQTVDVEAYLNGGISEAVNGRLAIKTTQSGKGWQQSLTRDDELGKKDVTAVRAMFDIRFNDAADLLLNFHYVDDQSDNKANTAYDGRQSVSGDLNEFSAPYTPLGDYLFTNRTPPWYSTGDNRAADWTNSYTDPQGRVFDLRPKRDNQLQGVSAKFEWVGDSISFTSITGYDEFERTETNDWDGGFFVDSSNINTTDLNVLSQELRLSGETDDLLWIAGVYYSDDELDEFYNYFLSDSVFGNGSIPFSVSPFQFAPILQLHTRYRQETESKALFGHVEWQMTDSLRLTAGLRYTEEQRSWSGCTFDAGEGSLSGFLNFAFGSSLTPGHCGTIDDDPNSPTFIFSLLGLPNVNDAFHIYQQTIDTNKWMGKIGIDYALNDDILLYASYSNGFKSGGFNGANSNTTRQLQAYKEEQLDSIELGLKATLLDGNMQLNAAIFDYDYEDKQEQDLAVTFVGNISGLTNVPKSSIKGAELDLQWLIANGLSMTLGVAYLDTEIKRFRATSRNSVFPNRITFDASGLDLAQSPEWQLSANIEYSWVLNNGWEMFVASDVNYKDSTTGGVDSANATDSYTVANLRLGLGSVDSQWRAILWSRNVTDEYYYPAAYQGGNGPFVRSVGMPKPKLPRA